MSLRPAAEGQDFWTRDRVASALNCGPRGTERFERIWTDTRSIQPGDLFVALKGERFDAHDFLVDAVGKGATGVVVSRAEAAKGLGVAAYVVTDTLAALGALGRYRRRAWNGPVVAVAGSNGKTSTKELIRAALGSRLEVHATTGNLNNLVGVPLTLLAIPDNADAAVIEMGTNQPGEIAELREIVEPTVSVITSVAEEHLEGLGDLAGVLKEEVEACRGAVAVVPAAQPEVVSAARAVAKRVVAAGIDEGDVRGELWTVDASGASTLRVGGLDVRVPLLGAHNARNAMLALAAAQELGVELADAARGIASVVATPMRGQVTRLGAATLINDAYNANPGSTRAALELLSRTSAGRQRVAVLGSMLELGAQAPRLHDELAKRALDDGVEVVAGIGEFAAALDRVAPGDPRVVTADELMTLWSRVSSRLTPDAVILLKGSRGMRLERLVEPITNWASAQRPS